MLLFLFAALYINFIPGEPIPIEHTINHIRKKHIYYENIDKINMSPSTQPINYKLLSNRKGELNNIFSEVIFITGDIELGEQLNNNCLIELNNDIIYNIILNNKVNDPSTIFIWNNSKTVKGIKFTSKINGKDTKMITLGSNMFVSLDYKDNIWNLNDMSFFENNKIIYNKYILKRCYNLFMNDIMTLSDECNNIVNKLNIFIKDNSNINESDRLKENTQFKNNCIYEIDKIYLLISSSKSKEILNKLINNNGCIFLDCNFIEDQDLLSNIQIMIDECLDEFKNSVFEYKYLCEFMIENTLLK